MRFVERVLRNCWVNSAAQSSGRKGSCDCAGTGFLRGMPLLFDIVVGRKGVECRDLGFSACIEEKKEVSGGRDRR